MDQAGARGFIESDDLTDMGQKGTKITVLNGNGHTTNGNGKAQDEGDALGDSRSFYRPVTARMPTEPDSEYYNMSHLYQGTALIFNHETFKVSGLKNRAGTQKDCQDLEALLKAMSFDVHTFKDLDYHELAMHVETFAKKDYSKHNCLMIFVLSHGELGVLYARDTAYKPEMLWTNFTADKCPTLAGKPKLFIIQACQGDKVDGGVTLSRTETDGQCTGSYRIPSQADFLIAYSTIPGYYSWRNTTNGSWFIQSLCREMSNNVYERDFLGLLTTVSRRVAIDCESNVPDTPHMHRQKQIPCVTTMLTRLIKFERPRSDESPQQSVLRVKTRASYRERTYI